MNSSTADRQSRKTSTILIADDSKMNQEILKEVVISLGHKPVVVQDGQSALDYFDNRLPDMLLLDMVMPHMNGNEVLEQLRGKSILEKVPVVVISSIDETEKIANCIRLGAKDYMVKPFNRTLLKARIEACLERKAFHEREDQYYQLIEDFNVVLERRVKEQIGEITKSHHSTIFAMSELAESRDSDTGAHLERMREYCKVLCLELQTRNKFQYLITDKFLEDIYIASPLHDLGKISIPDSILQKPGKLNDDEWAIMKRHTTIGADTLQKVFEKHPHNNFIWMGIEIAENHHEKWDGTGYPNGRKGENIPLAGRILALADVYDALTSKRCYKKALSHEESMKIILRDSGIHFDPDIVEAFLGIKDKFKEINMQFQDDSH